MYVHPTSSRSCALPLFTPSAFRRGRNIFFVSGGEILLCNSHTNALHTFPLHTSDTGLVLPDTLPMSWANLTTLRTLVIDCLATGGPGAPPPPGQGTSGGTTPTPEAVGRFGTPAQLESLRDLITAKKIADGPNIRNISIVNCGLEVGNGPEGGAFWVGPIPWTFPRTSREVAHQGGLDCALNSGLAVSGSACGPLKDRLGSLVWGGGAADARTVTLSPTYLRKTQGHYGELWSAYLSDVQIVNLSGNSLTGDFTSIDYFDKPCNDTFAGDDYGDSDCSSMQTLDVSNNRLAGPISTDAALGDDVTDAICSTACISLVLAPGVTDPEVLCRAPLVIFALDNPGLVYRAGTRFGSGYVTRDRSNWCFMPSSRWVLPTMWGVFIPLLLATLAVTLYARIRLKRVPFRINAPTFEVLARGTGGSTGSLNGSSLGGLDAASPGNGYVGLASSNARAIELAECQAMIPKISSVGGAGNGRLQDGGGGGGGGHSDSSSYSTNPPAHVNLAPAPTLPAVVTVTVTGLSGTSGGGGGASHSVNGSGSRWGSMILARMGKRDPNGIRVALTSGLVDSAGGGGDAKPGCEPIRDMDVELYCTSDLDPGSSCSANGGANWALDPAAAAPAGGSGGVSTGGAAAGGESRWRGVLRAVVSRALDILGMQLRTLLILGMFGLECYWAYGLIRYRGGWQLLVLIPNYLEHTLGGIAMLRAFMAGTHGRWKYVAPVPLLPFTMASVYLVYGFITYPFGWADFGPISWEKFIDLMDSCGVLSSTCWAIFSSLAYWQGNSVKTSYQFFNTDIFVGMMLMCFTDLLSTAHHLASTLQVPFKQWLRRELDVRKGRAVVAPDKSHRLQGDGDL
ncbi:hypothetical protein VOLCADRAFT_118464 [Volvox carteri f. nagariensis]|uniref:Uncharacterized protein n=1 Tax=Volvox carteri f. nagariensis TaxID=3068 RepID=D8U533_VOLCA|nr:uncharacterized protein VOLCADRAFT_118464 [Volvox carteri f. nagariensis]EFJ45076.1 hypothetical protein VOLCADRAFT_118464 [Volvox carteri f. nagariensis]|eukprot:XP_002953752.1 hypothetical protein VOLCADRAFT_118464 [Volvox carteri f. nagariensis]